MKYSNALAAARGMIEGRPVEDEAPTFSEREILLYEIKDAIERRREIDFIDDLIEAYSFEYLGLG